MSHPSSTRRLSARRVILWTLLLLIALAALWWFFLQNTADTDGDPSSQPGMPGGSVAVAAVTAQRGDFPVTLSALGTVRSLSSIEIRPRIEGELISVDFEEGQRVKKDQILAHIDDGTYQAQLAQANAELTQNQAQLATAREDLKRYENLSRANNVSRQDLETQRQVVRQYQGAVEASRANIQSARVQLDYTTLRAPADGIIGLRNVDPGNIVATGNDNPIATLTTLNPISVVFSLPGQYLARIRASLQQGRMMVSVMDDNAATPLARGELTSIDSAINTGTGTVRLRARMDNDDEQLYPNAFVNVELTLTTLENVVIIPETAIQNSESGNHVYVVDDNDTVHQRSVSVGASNDLRAVIESGLDADERVVVDGVDRLRDGASVKVVSNRLPGEEDAKDETPPAGETTNEDQLKASEAPAGESDQAS
ncbi:resistance-nodulation-cell division (RND) efflux membrane fusion protein [Kushneria pakistanensis]|uniref:Resistance-nodulation-cell division (RND) efflux membrane fusion protein n=1 Tax=Kushneria pakistanensis TaxID=1508770 RepID=A0ABQ3FNP4_9GAMM|nr:efflux RND transporter periplasmic adaptor subunit [Kushneria pakistanensis]GHC31809.1 resistance-nodulation-cell division (RND) efflux membrane fusion protein [Kushneria pakistanensis]